MLPNGKMTILRSIPKKVFMVVFFIISSAGIVEDRSHYYLCSLINCMTLNLRRRQIDIFRVVIKAPSLLSQKMRLPNSQD